MPQEINAEMTRDVELEAELAVGGSAGNDYEKLNNLPQVNGVTLKGNKTTEDLGINIPTKTSDLENDTGFVTSSDIPTKTSQLTNDSNFATTSDIPTNTSDLYNDSGFITSSALPTKTSELDNDSGFITADNYYDKTEIDTALGGKADKSDTYTKSQVDSALSAKANASDVVYRKNIYTKTNPTNTWTSGYYWGKTAYENSSYAYSSFLSVSGGDIVTISENAQFRFVEVYNSNGDIIDSVSSYVRTYTVPNNATSMVLTVSSSNLERKYPIIDKFSIVTCFKRNKGYSNFYLKWTSVTSGDLGTLCEHIDNKKNCEYFFTGKFTTFTSLEIGHGRTTGSYCIIDDTNLTAYVNGTQVQQFAHGLTLTDFITVSIKCGDIANARGSVTIQTNGGYYRKDDNFIFTGCQDSVYFIPLQSMTDCEFAYTIMDSRKDIFAFGDSYISLADSKKWVKYAIEDKDNNMLLCGYSGAKSTDEIIPFRRLNEQKNPLYVLWLLGMNDADNGAVNADWKTCVDEVIEYCNSHDVTPILATIPNVPNIDHTYKNAYVKASGCRYIDFAKAVNAESVGSTWYSGMLGTDNVHPTEAGAKALWLRAILDVPELIQ